MPQTPAELGTIDGETIEGATAKITGTVTLGRILAPGERVVLIAEGVAAGEVTVKRVDGRLVRIHRIKVEAAAEPFDELADETAAFLTAMADELNARAQLPFDEDELEDLDAAAGEDDEPEA